MTGGRSAVISPWIRKRAGVQDRMTRLLRCDACGSAAFDYRYSNGEMASIYAGYRDESYFETRNSWEPSYTRELNDDIGTAPEVVASRQEALSSLFGTVPGLSGDLPAVAVDIGGDRGQFIPTAIQRRFVVEVSGRQPFEGVTAVDSVSDVRTTGTDLVMMCGILEHVPDPLALVQDAVANARWSERRILYLEVPAGVPASQVAGARRWLAPLVGWVCSHSRRMWRRLDMQSSARRRGGTDWTLMPLRMSEHINFFTIEGLSRLAERAGGRVLSCDQYALASGLLTGGRLAFDSNLRLVAYVESIAAEE